MKEGINLENYISGLEIALTRVCEQFVEKTEVDIDHINIDSVNGKIVCRVIINI